MNRWPAVSVVMPVREEAALLAGAVAAVLDQDYPGPLEVVLAVGPSGDGTSEVASGLAQLDARVRVVANPAGSTSAALNAAVEASSGTVVARVDGHAELCPGYLRKAVELLAETGADNVGGVQHAVGTTPFERAVAAAMTSRFGVGNARFHYGGAPGPTDTVYLGVFRREALDRVGGFDATLVRNQDYELNWRLRATGGTVYFSPDLRVRYRPRGTPAALARQYFEYGRWKREVLRRHPRSLRWRQLAAPLAVAANLTAVALAARGRRAPLVVPGVYLAGVAGATENARVDSRARAWLPLVFATMHGAWGTGFPLGPPQRAAPEVTVS
ncbi:glycosyltransferase [soil metagenome]